MVPAIIFYNVGIIPVAVNSPLFHMICITVYLNLVFVSLHFVYASNLT